MKWIAYCLAVLSLAVPASSLADEQVLERAIDGWQRIVEGNSTVNARVIIKRIEPTKSETQSQIAYQGPLIKAQLADSCTLQNRDGLYELQKRDQWQLVRATPLASVPSEESWDKASFHNCRAICLLHAGPLPEVAANSDYVFQDWTVDADGFTRCTVVNNSAEKMKPFEVAKLVLDSGSHYRLQSYSYVQDIGGRSMEGRYEYEYSSDPLVPDSVAFNCSSSKGIKFAEVTEYRDISHEPLPEDEFSLAHFGLGDRAPQKSNSRLLVGLAALLGVVAAVFAFRYLKQS